MGSSRPQPKGLAAKLRQIRASLDLTQQEMVKRLKSQRIHLTLYPGNISRFEQGLREPPLLVLLAYARVARITIDVLVDDDLELPGYLSADTAKQRRNDGSK
jgi:transcriptional regulator with XRE-family HTH domain